MAYTLASQGPRDTLWAAFNDLRVAHRSLGLSSGALRSLQAILSFVSTGGRLVVHAGNRILCERTATSERTLRRHIVELVAQGLLARRDSSNRKRFRLGNGDAGEMAFGLDVAPLAAKAGDLAALAQSVRSEQAAAQIARQALMLAIQRAEAVLPLPDPRIEAARKLLRRKLGARDLEAATRGLCAGIEAPGAAPILAQAVDMTGSNGQNDRHIQETKEEESLTSCAPDKNHGPVERGDLPGRTRQNRRQAEDRQVAQGAPDLLALAQSCPEATAFCETPLRSDEDVLRFAWSFGPLIGVPQPLLMEGARSLGPGFVAAAILKIAQAGAAIRSPGAYFRALVTGPKAAIFARSLSPRRA